MTRQAALVDFGTQYPNGRMFGVRVRELRRGLFGGRTWSNWLTVVGASVSDRQWEEKQARELADDAVEHGWVPSTHSGYVHVIASVETT